MVFYAAFNSISVISRQQITLFMSSWVSPVLSWGSAVSCPRTLPRKNPEDPGPLHYESNTLPLSHAGPLMKNSILSYNKDIAKHQSFCTKTEMTTTKMVSMTQTTLGHLVIFSKNRQA